VAGVLAEGQDLRQVTVKRSGDALALAPGPQFYVVNQRAEHFSGLRPDCRVVQCLFELRAALARVERLVLQDHVEHCVADAVSSGNKAEREREIEELISVLNSAT
jgi:hypothetical protein